MRVFLEIREGLKFGGAVLGIEANDSLLTVIGVKMSIYFGVGGEGWGRVQGFDILLLSASKWYFRP